MMERKLVFAGFKPLQSGAGFLCGGSASRTGGVPQVSNPFRAGRDSSEKAQVQGSLVASQVSNPFRAGRDSSGFA